MKGRPPLLVFYVARNPSCRLSQAFMRMRCAAALCSAPAVTHPYIRPGVAGNRFRNSVWLVIQARTMLMHLLSHNMARRSTTNDPEHRATAVRLTIRIPPRRLCTLCRQVHAALDLQHPDRPTRCRSCQRRERCSGCLSLKKRKHFHNANHANQPFKTFQS
jgi:hypothetical protein